MKVVYTGAVLAFLLLATGPTAAQDCSDLFN